MSVASSGSVALPRWLPAGEFRALGFVPGGPEIDYGFRWGDRGDIRVSFAPHGHQSGGFLYAHNQQTDRCLLLVAQTTQREVDVAWRELIATDPAPDAYLRLATLGHDTPPITAGEAVNVLLHSLDRELDTYRKFVTASPETAARFDAAFAVVVQRSARVSAEQLLLDAAGAECADSAPVLVRYRVLEEPGWIGRIAGPDVDFACSAAKQAVELGHKHELTMQATSVTHGRTTLAAARVPELEFAAPRSELGIDGPSVGI